MKSINDEIAELQERITQAQRARVTAEFGRANAEAEVNAARQALKTTFGVTTADEARAKLAELEEQLQTAATALRAALDEIGA